MLDYIEICRDDKDDSIFDFLFICRDAFREVQGKERIPRWFWNKYWLAKNKETFKKELVLKLKNLFDEREYPEEELCAYSPEGPTSPKPIGEQIERISDLFHLSKVKALRYIKNLPAVPEGADHFYAIPSSKAMFPKEKTFFMQYTKAIEFAVSSLGIGYPHNMKWAHLRIDPAVEMFIHKLEQEQGGIFIVPIGYRHGGRSCRRAQQFFLPNELLIWLLAGISITETNPEWFKADYSEVGRTIVCGGESIYPGSPYIVDIKSDKKPWISAISPERQAGIGKYCLTTFDI